MAGHSKWANNKHHKSAQDTKRGKIFTKIIGELVTAARLGGGDITSNTRLRAAIDKESSNNMTKDKLNRAISRGIGSNRNHNMETVIYEGYGSGGTAIMVECLSDNRNRTTSSIRHAFTKCGGNLSIDGSVAYLFTKRGVISYASGINNDSLIEVALEAGAADIKCYNDCTIDVYTFLENLVNVKDYINKAGFNVKTTKVIMIPSIKVNLDVNTAEKLFRLIKILEESNDVQNVYHNGEISDKVSAKL